MLIMILTVVSTGILLGGIQNNHFGLSMLGIGLLILPFVLALYSAIDTKILENKVKQHTATIEKLQEENEHFKKHIPYTDCLRIEAPELTCEF